MNTLLEQIKERRKKQGLKQRDMALRTGLNRQQYSLIEAKGNPTLETLDLIAAGLNSKLLLVPADKMHLVMRLLDNDTDFEEECVTEFDSESVWDELIGDLKDD